MATRKQTARSLGDPDDEAEIETIEPSPADELQAALSELGEAGSGGRVKIERVRPDKRTEYVTRMDASVFSLEALQEQHGGGEYRITILDGAGKYRGSRTVIVAPPANAKPAAAAPSSEVAQLAEAIKKQGDLLLEFIVRGSAAPAQQPLDRKAFLDELLIYKQLFDGGNKSGGGGMGADQVLAILKTGMDIAKDGSGGSETNWADILKAGIEQVGPSLANALDAAAASAKAQPATAAPGRALPASATKPAIAAPASSNPAGGNVEKFDLKKWVSFLIEKAEKGADPELYADLVLDNIPEAQAPEIFAQLEGKTAEQVVVMLARFDERVNAHVEWFRDLGQAVLGALADDGDAIPGSDADGGNGNAGNDS